MKKIIFILVFLVILGGIIFFYTREKTDIYQFKGNKLYYSQERGIADYEILSREENDSIEILKIKFKSRPLLTEELSIYGLLFMPKNSENLPGVIFLPAGQATKEGRTELLMRIAKEGYAVLSIDQRGVGETAGSYLSFEQDYEIFSQGKEPMQHLAVYDALRSFDVMKEFKEINKNRIGIIGESMGARYGIIAAAIDKRLKGVVSISSSGFHIGINPLQPGNDYLVSVDPDNYISDISPNFVMVLHGTNDSVVPLQDAQTTYRKAKEPKRFFIAEGCEHGYCEKMWNELKIDLKTMLEN